mmetsp:Transcript_25528/g.43583  ORF Transcript_25528/g.43583 Transcript_25528/m.43583 type:complete len:295 (-) Transcript_25528:97-981(-)
MTTMHLIFSLHNIIRNRQQRSRSLTKRSQALLRLINQFPCILLTSLQSHQFNICRLVCGLVLTSSLSQIFGRCRTVQNIICYLERQSDIHCKLFAGGHLFGRGSSEDSARGYGHLKQCGRFVNVNPFEIIEGRARLTLAFEIHDLSSSKALGTNGFAKAGDDVNDPIGGHALCVSRDVFEGSTEEGVTREDGNVLTVDDMVGRLASSQVVVVHGGEIVVNQTHGVDHLECDCRGHGHFLGTADHFAGGYAEDRADALSAGHERVAHGFANFVGLGNTRFDGCLEGCLDGTLLGH